MLWLKSFALILDNKAISLDIEMELLSEKH
jgi:hypothetical protein